MNYIRHSDEKINLARFAYLLGRIEPARDADEQTKQKHLETCMITFL